MRILALDSSGTVASVAIMEDGATVAEFTVNHKKTHSQTLLPMIDGIVKLTETDLSGIDAIAVAGGPGSFTGLRIGSATAKGLGLALDKPIICVPTLEGLAYNLYGCAGLICPIMDARRGQVYTGLYRFESGFEVVEGQMAIALPDLTDKINGYGCKVTFVGDGASVYGKEIEAGLSVEHGFAPPHMNRQRAAAVGALGMKYYAEGKIPTADDHHPEYLRPSQAERERAERDARVSRSDI